MELPSAGVYGLVLGIAQDAGVPHAGCLCHRCAAAQVDPSLAEFAAALAIVDARRRPASVWLVDATPDITYQLHLLAGLLGPHPVMPGRLRQPEAVFLTHAHMGHTAGLAHLGPEAMNVHHLPVYASAGLVDVLRDTRLWRPLMDNLELKPLAPGVALELADQLSITPVSVPHRDELAAGTFAFRIQGPGQSLLYLPDIDDWSSWPEAQAFLAGVNVALADASFYSADELGGRPPVAHPLVPDTLAFLADSPVQLILTHLNHTNPLLDPASQERLAVTARGAAVAYTGQVIELSPSAC
ncbi:MAG: pyrroloquinoline quinone biosynthesis protein PqqB [Chloroflexota bacterium]|nr:MAG: pyrroloquinoline quinone biosynthesis protein PqqB [Chloroflexota bacterium]